MNHATISTDIDILSMTKRPATNEASVAPIATFVSELPRPNRPSEKSVKLERSSDRVSETSTIDDFSFGIPSQAWLEVDLDPIISPVLRTDKPPLALPVSTNTLESQQSLAAVNTPSRRHHISHVQPMILLSDCRAPSTSTVPLSSNGMPFSPRLPHPSLPLSTIDQNIKTSTPKLPKGQQRTLRSSRLNASTPNSTSGRDTVRITPPLCNCGRRTKQKVASSPGPNEGKPFFACPKSRATSCGYFEWEQSLTSSILSDFTPELLNSDFEH